MPRHRAKCKHSSVTASFALGHGGTHKEFRCRAVRRASLCGGMPSCADVCLRRWWACPAAASYASCLVPSRSLNAPAGCLGCRDATRCKATTRPIADGVPCAHGTLAHWGHCEEKTTRTSSLKAHSTRQKMAALIRARDYGVLSCQTGAESVMFHGERTN